MNSFRQEHLLILLTMSVQLQLLMAYPQLPTPYSYPPMSSLVGMEPIMPANFPLGGLGHHFSSGPPPSPNPSINNSPFFAGRGFSGFGGSSPNSMNSLLIRNSPYQAPIPTMPGASPFALNQQLGGSEAPMQQPIFPNGKYGMGPSAAVLPSEIPMDVLVGRQIGLNELSQSASSSGGRHPFPLGPFFGSDGGRGPSSVGGPFGTDFSPKGMAPQYGHGTNMMQQEFVGSLNSQPAHSTIPDMINQSPLASMPSQPVINAETYSDPNSSSLPVFLRGAPQDQIDEFKRIIRQQNGTYAEQIQQIDALVQRMEPKRQTLYREFMHENDEREHLHRDRVHKTVGEMSENAQEQFTKISATLRNPNVPDQERWDRVLQLYGKMEPELRNEFEQKFKGFPTFGPTSH